jgi:hypothetical protein
VREVVAGSPGSVCGGHGWLRATAMRLPILGHAAAPARWTRRRAT